MPAVNIGTRQCGRCKGENVLDVNYSSDEIYEAIHKQLNHGKYKPDPIYGDGNAGKRIAEILSDIDLESIPIKV